jgi:hypothetical protein
MESSGFRLLQAGSGYDQLGSSRVCKDARIFVKVASKKLFLFEIQFNSIICVCFVHIEIIQVKQFEALSYGAWPK